MIEQFFQRVLELKNVPRQGWKEKLEMKYPESVADHSYSVTIMSMIISDLEGLNTEKIIRMALLHDLAESVIGDIIPNKLTNDEKRKWKECEWERLYVEIERARAAARVMAERLQIKAVEEIDEKELFGDDEAEEKERSIEKDPEEEMVS